MTDDTGGFNDVEPDIPGRAYEYLPRKFVEGSVRSGMRKEEKTYPITPISPCTSSLAGEGDAAMGPHDADGLYIAVGLPGGPLHSRLALRGGFTRKVFSPARAARHPCRRDNSDPRHGHGGAPRDAVCCSCAGKRIRDRGRTSWTGTATRIEREVRGHEGAPGPF